LQNLGPFGAFLAFLDLLGPFWAFLGFFGPFWAFLGLCGAFDNEKCDHFHSLIVVLSTRIPYNRIYDHN
jgi:hypothetical protein